MLIHINASELKSVFKDIKPIYKGIQDAALMSFTVENHIFYITCASGVMYEQQIASEHPGPYSLTVLYQDLSEILPGHGVVELDLSPLYVGIKAETMSSTLQQANGLISRYKRRCNSFSKISPGDVKQWASIFSETAPVAKSLQREAAIIFKPPVAIMKFHTLWLQLPNAFLDTVMDLRELRAVAEFSPTEYGASSDTIEFKRGSAILAVQRNPSGECKTIDEMLKDHSTPKTLAGGNYLMRIQQFLRSVGPGACRCYFYTDGISIVVSRPRVQSSLQIGACKNPITAITTSLEYVQMLFKIFAEANISISAGKSSIHLYTPTKSLLLSII